MRICTGKICIGSISVSGKKSGEIAISKLYLQGFDKFLIVSCISLKKLKKIHNLHQSSFRFLLKYVLLGI